MMIYSTCPPQKSPEIKSHLLLRRKAMTNLKSVLKSSDVELPTKVYIVNLVFLRAESPLTGKPGGLQFTWSQRVRHNWATKHTVFPVVMNGCESWTINKAEHWIIDAFKLCCWRRLLRVPWTARKSNQSILKEINPECSLEGLMQLQYFGHRIQRADSFEKTLMLGKIEGRRREQ